MFKKVMSVCCVFALTALFCVSASYAAGTAVIKSCEGEVMIKAAGADKWVPAKANATLNSGDSIQTKTGTAEVVYPDKSVLKVKNNTTTTLSEMKDEKSGKLTRKVKIMMGDMWAKITPGTPTKTEFETPSAVAAVKGTEVSFSVAADGTTQVLTDSGLVTLQVGQSMSVDIGGGQAVQVTATADGANIAGLAGSVTVNMANGSSVTLNAGSAISGSNDGSTIAVTAGEATVTGADGSAQTLTAGNQVTVSPTGAVSAPTAAAPAPAAGAASVPQQNTSGDSTTTDGKSIAPANNGNPYVNPEGGNIGDKKEPISPSNP